MELENALKKARRQSYYTIVAASILTLFALGMICLLYIAHVTDLQVKSHFSNNNNDNNNRNETNQNNATIDSLNKPVVVLISVDGFRADYWQNKDLKNSHPHLSKLVKHGIRAQHMKPVFPSKTFPNHWVIDYKLVW
jgi:PHD/YefM family antitoxin component YafN of YafNO toxin-antitoxin module